MFLPAVTAALCHPPAATDLTPCEEKYWKFVNVSVMFARQCDCPYGYKGQRDVPRVTAPPPPSACRSYPAVQVPVARSRRFPTTSPGHLPATL